ncbi:hypothetical protein HMPREF2826_08580 [Olsenella sp. HMSC062G07]|nr:hypothetical protein HMPREF2826_08580 [Olsenella sp. HMSC062G07]
MPNMTDYLRWRGDLHFDERPFNEVDALVLATASYLDLARVVPPRGSCSTLGDACAQILAEAQGDLSPFVRSLASLDVEFVRALATSRRFGTLRLSGCVDVVDESRALQFAAMCVELPEALVIAFRGTDSTLVGWREDFLLASTVTQAQRCAADYLDGVLRAAGAPPLVLTGHSKGGCLVEYALATCPDEQLGRIELAYSFDGPGLDRTLCPVGAHERAGAAFRRIQPSYSVVGQLMDRPEAPRRYVLSSERGLGQHDPLSWQVGPTGLCRAEGLDSDARLLSDTLALWLDGIDLDARARLVDELFSILEAGGATTLPGIIEGGSIGRVLAAAAGASDETRAVVARLLDILGRATRKSLANDVREGMEGLAKGLRRRGEELVQRGAQGLAAAPWPQSDDGAPGSRLREAGRAAHEQGHDGDDDGTDEGGAKRADRDAGVEDLAREVAGKLQHDGVDNEVENAERQNREGKGQKLHDGPDGGVHEGERQREHGGTEVGAPDGLDAGHEPDSDERGDGGDDPSSNKAHEHSFERGPASPRVAGR